MITYIFLIVCAFDICNIMYPDETDIFISIIKTKLINLSYYSIYYFSCGQILFSKIKTRCQPILKIVGSELNQFLINHHIIHPNSVQNPSYLGLEFYSGGQYTQQLDLMGNDAYVIYTNNKIVFLDNKYECLQTKYTNFDLIFISYKEVGQNCVNKLHFTSIPKQISYSKCYIRFLSVELIYKNNIFPIKLETELYNHYYVGNIIDSDFFKYYLTSFIILDSGDSDNFTYIVSIIDQNVNILTLGHNHSIILEENDYKLIDKNDIQENDEEDKKDKEDKNHDTQDADNSSKDLNTNYLTDYITLDNTCY